MKHTERHKRKVARLKPVTTRGVCCGRKLKYSDRLVAYACKCTKCKKRYIEWYGLEFVTRKSAQRSR